MPFVLDASIAACWLFANSDYVRSRPSHEVVDAEAGVFQNAHREPPPNVSTGVNGHRYGDPARRMPQR